MASLDELYYQMLRQAVENKEKIVPEKVDPRMIACLAQPDDAPLIWRVKPCVCTTDSKEPCAAAAACDWDAIQMDPEKGMIIDVIQNGKPVARRRFRVRTIGPKFCQYTGIISPFNDLRGVGLPSNRVDRIAIFLVTSVHVIVKVIIR